MGGGCWMVGCYGGARASLDHSGAILASVFDPKSTQRTYWTDGPVEKVEGASLVVIAWLELDGEPGLERSYHCQHLGLLA